MTARTKGTQRRALGKGLGALIPGAGSGPGKGAGSRDYFLCPVDLIVPQPDQPRKHFDKDLLDQLAANIREEGLIQPLVVRKIQGGSYELIAGERRWRAAMMAGLKELPVVIKDVNQDKAFELALVENLQREDLNPIEEAVAFRRLIDDHGHSQAEVAARIGRDRSSISNSLRLLKLPNEVKAMVLDGNLSEGHARALLQAGSVKAIIALARTVVARGLSVRETERQARALALGSDKTKKASSPRLSPQVRNLRDQLQRELGARVKIVDVKGKGRLEITYTSYEELDGILDKILK